MSAVLYAAFPPNGIVGEVDGRPITISRELHAYLDDDRQRTGGDADAIADFTVKSPTITLAGDLSGSVTLTDLNSGTLNAVIQKDSTITLTGDATGSAIMNNLGDVSISVTVGGLSAKVDNVNLTDLGTSGTSTVSQIEAAINAINAALR